MSVETEGRRMLTLRCSNCDEILTDTRGATKGFFHPEARAMVFPCPRCTHQNGIDGSITMTMGALPDA
jgi:phage FluMu protein Com